MNIRAFTTIVLMVGSLFSGSSFSHGNPSRDDLHINQFQPDSLFDNKEQFSQYWRALLWDVATINPDFMRYLEARSEYSPFSMINIYWGLNKIAGCANKSGALHISNQRKACTQESLASIPFALSYIYKGLLLQTWDASYGEIYRKLTSAGWYGAAAMTGVLTPLIYTAGSTMTNTFLKLTEGDRNMQVLGAVSKVMKHLPNNLKAAGQQKVAEIVTGKIYSIFKETVGSVSPLLAPLPSLSTIAFATPIIAAIPGLVSSYWTYENYSLFVYLLEQINPTESNSHDQQFLSNHYDNEYVKSQFYSQLNIELFNAILVAKLEQEEIDLDTSTAPDTMIHGSINSWNHVEYLQLQESTDCYPSSCHQQLSNITTQLEASGGCLITGFSNELYPSHIAGINSYIVRLCQESNAILISMPGLKELSIRSDQLTTFLSVIYRIFDTNKIAVFKRAEAL